MCGLVVVAGAPAAVARLGDANTRLAHRGPDDAGTWISADGATALAHRRLSIIDLSAGGHQPMVSADGRFVLAFNGEIYNHLELRHELGDPPLRSHSDSEVLLEAFARWGAGCLDRLLGMFAFVVYDTVERRLFAARDRFGVKPLFVAGLPGGGIGLASEIKALHELGVPREPDTGMWARYLVDGTQDLDDRTFWAGIGRLGPGQLLDVAVTPGMQGPLAARTWYDVAERLGPVAALDAAAVSDDEVADAFGDLLVETIRLRFRADVPVGVNLSGGVDSSTLLAGVHAAGEDAAVRAFTFVTGDPAYDELPWVEEMVARTGHPLTVCRLDADDVPVLAGSVAAMADEPIGGIPTLAYASLFERARADGVLVLLDGQGIDEAWAGYDYYWSTLEGGRAATVQGTAGDSPVRPAALTAAFGATAAPSALRAPFGDPLRDAQYRDLRHTKLVRALRYNDRVSMRSSCELREPFLDHRLVELGLRQPAARKLGDGVTKRFVRRVLRDRLPGTVVDAPKRPLQTPQREWLAGPLRPWVQELVSTLGRGPTEGWFEPAVVDAELQAFFAGRCTNSYFVWQWLNTALLLDGS
jgi:asparagine synthase (glutamine-hydrolysing)